MKENSYAVKKRFDHLIKIMEHVRPQKVLDFGCGTGSALTAPIAAAFPNIQFFGIEAHLETLSIAKIKHSTLKNLNFSPTLDSNEKFDLILASEVIEHVYDSKKTLYDLHQKLQPGGFLFITMPNGFGPFEILSLIESVLRYFRRLLMPKRKTFSSSSELETLANSPHIRFFTFTEIKRILRTSGFRIDSYRGRSFLCGLGISPLIDSSSLLLKWNGKMADRLPPFFCSSWMFLCSKTHLPSFPLANNEEAQKEGWYRYLKRTLNLRNARCN